MQVNLSIVTCLKNESIIIYSEIRSDVRPHLEKNRFYVRKVMTIWLYNATTVTEIVAQRGCWYFALTLIK